MKPHKRLKASLEAISASRGKVKFSDWIAKQPGSTKRGVAKGRFKLPEYVMR